uniref:protein-serine/threonine phosphatase n=1 Tax=Zonotrichia albicollis TaxID=44394 RepID=A0A8D2QFW5_ZONAL
WLWKEPRSHLLPFAAVGAVIPSQAELGSCSVPVSLSESFFMVKGAALFLQQGNSSQGQRSLQHPHKHAGDLPQHLQVMINLLRCEDRIKLAVRLESVWSDRVRYMVVVYSNGRQDTEENILLGVYLGLFSCGSVWTVLVKRAGFWHPVPLGTELWSWNSLHRIRPSKAHLPQGLFGDRGSSGCLSWSHSIDYILNVTREIDNFFPGLFAYHNIRVYDEETTDLLAHWNEAYHFINKAKKNHSKCLVHCKMGVSRSASTVIAYAMKEFGWSLEKAYNYVKQKRSITRPNAGFMRQLLEYEGILDASKQRHNKLWKQQAESNLPQNTDGTAGSGDFLLESLDIDLENRLADLDMPSQSAYLDNRAGSEGFGYCFRRLSDTLLENKIPGDREGFFHMEQLERDALAPERAEPLAELGGFCEKEAKKKLDFSPRKGRMVLGEPGEDGVREENPMEKWKRRLSMHKEESRLNRENLNNNNSKRSCPEDFEHDAVFGILSKVKPSYQSCTDCMYSSAGLAPEPFGEQCERLSAGTARRSSTICTQPPLLPHLHSHLMEHLPSRAPPEEPGRTKHNEAPLPLAPGAVEVGTCRALDQHCGLLERGKDAPKTPEKTLQPRRNSHCDRSLLHAEVVREESLARKDPRPTKDVKYLLFSKDLEKPSANSYLMQHQESLLQLQKAGLVRKHTKELERLKSLPSDPSVLLRDSPLGRVDSSIVEESEDLMAHPGLVPLLAPAQLVAGDAENDVEKLGVKRVLEGISQKTSTPAGCRLEHTSSFTKDFLKTICYTPSSSRSSNLTRSSSSDSIHSVRGKPGLVKQRTQEIETRLRLAGLTVSSPLKRSNSLAKLGCLNLSSEDLSSDVDVATITDSKEAVSSECSVLCEPPARGADVATITDSKEAVSSECSALCEPPARGADGASKAGLKPLAGNLKNTLWMGKS